MVPLTSAEVASLKVGYATPCLGMNASHTLEIKFKALADHGFKYVELGFGNYVAWVRGRHPDLPPSSCPAEWKVDDEPDPADEQIWQAMYDETGALRGLAKDHGLILLIMQPFNQFDGWPKGHEREEWVKRKAERWLKLCSMLGVEFLQVGANDQAGQGAGDDKTAEDMRWLAQLGADQESPVKIAYEPWCFSPRVSDWEHCYEIIKKASHDNLGLCLDTAQMAISPAYGFDPLTGKGWEDTAVTDLIERLEALPKDKIFFFEISDVLRPDPPLTKGSPYDQWHIDQGEGNPPRSSWVLCARAIPYVGRRLGKDVKDAKDEADMGSARVAEIARAVFSTGFRGPVIWEVFEALEMENEDKSVPDQYAEASSRSRETFFKEVTGGA